MMPDDHVERFRGELKNGGQNAERKLLAQLERGDFRRRKAQAVKIALDEFRATKNAHQRNWEVLRKWFAIGISILTVIIVFFRS